jgi:predicted GTPase
MSAAERQAAISQQIAQYQHQQQHVLQEIQAALHNETQVLDTAAVWHVLHEAVATAVSPARVGLQEGRQAAHGHTNTGSVEEQISTLTLLSKTREYGMLLAVSSACSPR